MARAGCVTRTGTMVWAFRGEPEWTNFARTPRYETKLRHTEMAGTRHGQLGMACLSGECAPGWTVEASRSACATAYFRDPSHREWNRSSHASTLDDPLERINVPGLSQSLQSRWRTATVERPGWRTCNRNPPSSTRLDPDLQNPELIWSQKSNLRLLADLRRGQSAHLQSRARSVNLATQAIQIRRSGRELDVRCKCDEDPSATKPARTRAPQIRTSRF
jgi:hypothetical protein